MDNLSCGGMNFNVILKKKLNLYLYFLFENISKLELLVSYFTIPVKQ